MNPEQWRCASAADIHREVDRRFGHFVREGANRTVDERDAVGEECPRWLIQQAAEVGLFGLALPVGLGGLDIGQRAWGLVLEQLGYLSADAAFPALLSARVWVTAALAATGRRDVVETYAKRCARADLFASFAFSDVGDPFAFGSTVRRSGDRLVVTGEKPIVTGAVGADVYMVFVEDETSSDMAVVLLERGDGGVEVEPVDPMGVRALGLGTLRMRDVVVPASRMIVESDGLTFAQRMLNARRVLLAAGLVGGMRALHEHCVRQLAATCRYGVPLTDFPNVQAALGRQVVVVQTAQATLHQALSALDSGAADAAFDSCVSACKHAVTEAAVDLGISALRLLGGRGYLRGRAERFLRDACSMLSAAGAQDVLEVSLGLRAATAATRPRPPYGVTVPVQLVEAAR